MTNSVPSAWGIASRPNLPAEIASFIGRERELAEVKRILQRERLLTLIGTGGCGKTRLAFRAAADLAGNFADGVRLVQLAPLTDSNLIPRAVAATLGMHGTSGRPLVATLAAALAPRRLLLVLDNCEHLIGACARLAEALLRACPHLRILATSREPLRIPGEIVWRVPSLTLPEEGPLPPPESLAQVEAVALFLDRARARQPDFALTDHNAPSVAAICRQVEGLPLGIELAAAQMGVLTPEQIANRLDNALRLLGGGVRTLPRQETLRATLDWSNALLSDRERTLFRRLAAFTGGFDLDTAEGVCSGDGIERTEVLHLLTGLVEKSLVEPLVKSREARYRLLEPVRQYAWEHFTEHDEDEAVQRCHAHYFLQLAEASEPKLMSGERGPWIERLATDEDNLRTALAWAERAIDGNDNEVGLRMAGVLVWYWIFRGEVGEGLDWVEGALARVQEATPAVRAKALYTAGELAWLAGQAALARERAEESEALWRELGDKRWLAYTLQSLPMATDHPRSREAVAESLQLFEEVGDRWGAAMAMAAVDLFEIFRDGDPTGSGRAQLEEALARWREVGDDWGVAMALNSLGDLARSQGDDMLATARYEEALVLLRRQDLMGTVPSLLHNLGYLALHRSDTRRALRLFRESLVLFRDQGDQRGIADCLTGLAGVLGAMRQPERAAQLFGSAEALREVIGATVWPANAADHDRSMDLVRGQMEDTAFAVAWAVGRGLPMEQAIAVGLSPEPVGGLDGDVGGSGLTRREREVAVLVAQGLTNRQIGAALFIAEGTARLHVKHSLQKLGFTSRAQIAGWAVEQGLTTAAPEAR